MACPDSDPDLKLWCIMHDVNATPNDVFSVDIGYGKTIADLKRVINSKAKFGHIQDATRLKLYCVSIPLNDDLLKNVTDFQYPESELLLPWKVLSQVFPVVNPDHLNVVAVAPPGSTRAAEAVVEEKRDEVPALKRRFLTALATISKPLAPAESATSSVNIKSQLNRYICNGPYGAKNPRITVAPPVQLFHPVFAHFLDDVKEDGEIPNDIVTMATTYMGEATAVYDNEYDRRNQLGPKLDVLLNIDVQLITNDNTLPDGVVELNTSSGHSAVLLVKADLKNQFGDGNSISKQLGLSMARSWIQPRFESIRNRTCCPTFLIASVGPWIAVLGAVFTDVVIIQHLTDSIWIGLDSALNDEHCERVARLFYSLRKSLDRLRGYYNELELAVNPPLVDSRFFPSINAYLDNDGKIVTFEYKGFLENNSCCVTLLAERSKETVKKGPKKQKIQRIQKLVVKFVDRYEKGLHVLLAKAKRAPKLYYCGKPGVNEQDSTYGKIQMVVMEYIDGMSVSKAASTSGLDSVKGGLEDCLCLLHEDNYVFGDLRMPNVIVTNESKVKLVDFDWAGDHGKTQVMSEMIQWPKGVGPSKVMGKDRI